MNWPELLPEKNRDNEAKSSSFSYTSVLESTKKGTESNSLRFNNGA
ncbi:hypothetical protein PAJ34TS1_57650 [Paenibacillus azoreducens]